VIVTGRMLTQKERLKVITEGYDLMLKNFMDNVVPNIDIKHDLNKFCKPFLSEDEKGID
jgi:hypothetical protein